jgi:hypothetical protein
MFGIISFTHNLSRLHLWLITIVLFALFTLPRFNRNTMLVDRPLNDARYFIAYVEYFRGEVPSDAIRPASNWRLLVPAVAAQLPFAPMTAINIVNILCLALSVVFLFKSLQALHIYEPLLWIGCWLFIASFPTFYYTCIGYVDPGALLFISMGINATLRNSFFGLLLAMLLGTAAKETIILLIPFVLGYYWPTNRTKAIGWTLALTLVFIAENILIREFVYITPGERNPAFWSFSTEAIMLNVNRLNSYLAPLLSFGLPGVLWVWALSKTGFHKILQTPILLASVLMVFASLGLFGISVVATYGDGRMIWPSNYAMIMAGAVLLSPRLNPKIT